MIGEYSHKSSYRIAVHFFTIVMFQTIVSVVLFALVGIINFITAIPHINNIEYVIIAIIEIIFFINVTKSAIRTEKEYQNSVENIDFNNF